MGVLTSSCSWTTLFFALLLSHKAGVKVHQEAFSIGTIPRALSAITNQVTEVVRRSGVQTGLCTVFVRHTSASLIITENADPAVRRDLERWVSDLAPESRRWEHDDEGPDDMPAHAKCALTKTSESIPISSGRLVLGTWQGIFLWEHRSFSHDRGIVVHVSGI